MKVCVYSIRNAHTEKTNIIILKYTDYNSTKF